MNSSDLSGRIHSIETLGAADGPGLRLIIFLQGCPLRCQYCHNPDTWQTAGGTLISVSDLVRRAKRFKPYFGNSGGVTISGGEPLLQADFTAALLYELKKAGLSTALDTSGCLPSGASDQNLSMILNNSNLIILDIKSPDPAKFQSLTSCPIQPLINFIGACEKFKSLLRIRQVIVPEWNDQPDDIYQLAGFLAKWADLNLEKIELLPYHTLGEVKYEKLDKVYPLSGLPAMDREKLKSLQTLADKLISHQGS